MPVVTVSTYKIPCSSPESDGTLVWNSTTLIVVTIEEDGKIGTGFSYGHEASADIIKDTFFPILKKTNLSNIPRIYEKMKSSVRNIGIEGIVAHAISAVDTALWDLKAKVLEKPLCALWGMAKDKMPVYGSGGFTSYSFKEITTQFQRWKERGINKFKMKIGRDPSEDVFRIKHAREAIGDHDELFVDANGAFSRKQSIEIAEKFSKYNVTWFEEPVPSSDLEGLNLLRNHMKINIAAGEYGYDIFYFRRMLEAQAVDILQADASRCCGYTGFFEACTLSSAFSIPLSSHTAPSLHLHACLSHVNVCHMEFFHDHALIEERYFEGFPALSNGYLVPYLDRFGHGLELKTQDIKKYLTRQEII